MSAAIKQYISTKYDQHPDMFKKDLEAIDQMRSNAVNSLEAHVSGVQKLTLYAAQLVWIGGKFPIDIGVDFTWYPALGFNTQIPESQKQPPFRAGKYPLQSRRPLFSTCSLSESKHQ